MTINEALSWKKTLQNRHLELVRLRDQNSNQRRVRYQGQPDEVEEPTYDAKKLDKTITLIARELRILDTKIKATNAITQVPDYTADENILGELED